MKMIRSRLADTILIGLKDQAKCKCNPNIRHQPLALQSQFIPVTIALAQQPFIMHVTCNSVVLSADSKSGFMCDGNSSCVVDQRKCPMLSPTLRFHQSALSHTYTIRASRETIGSHNRASQGSNLTPLDCGTSVS